MAFILRTIVNLRYLLALLSVCIGPKFCVGPRMTLGKVYLKTCPPLDGLSQAPSQRMVNWEGGLEPCGSTKNAPVRGVVRNMSRVGLNSCCSLKNPCYPWISLVQVPDYASTPSMLNTYIFFIIASQIVNFVIFSQIPSIRPH